MENIITKFDKFINENVYNIFRPNINEPSTIELDGIPKLWAMTGPLPDNVIEYIKKNQSELKNADGSLFIHKTTNLPLFKDIRGKNKGDVYIYDEEIKNWYTDHVKFWGKAVYLTPTEWNKIFEK